MAFARHPCRLTPTIPCRFPTVVFDPCRLTGTPFDPCQFTGSDACPQVRFPNCGLSELMTPVITQISLAINPAFVDRLEGLAVRRDQLQVQLAAVDAQEAVLAQAGRPSSLEEIDALEGQLKGAMEELKARRAELKQKK